MSQKDYYAEAGDYVHGEYKSVSLEDIINHFIVVYVGEDKIIPKVKRLDVAFHAQRAVQELTFDTLGSNMAQEITVPSSLKMILPHNYVNYRKISTVDSAGIKHLLYPTSKTSNPRAMYQNDDGEYFIQPVCTLTLGSNTVVLDGDYSDTLVNGMRVESIGGWTIDSVIHVNSYIYGITTNAGITSIELAKKNGHASLSQQATASRDERLNITRFNILGQAMRLANQSLIETKATAVSVTGDNFITVADTTGIKKGMFINHKAFLGGTTVLSVGTSTIITSTPVFAAPATATVGINDIVGFMTDNVDSSTYASYKSATPSENQDDYQDDTYWPADGSRFGLDPQHAQTNGSFYFDAGNIHFSSNLAGKTVILDYIGDGMVGTHTEVHKFAEEAVYKWILHAILASKANTPEYLVARYKKERFAAIRTAKLRLSNIKLEEFTQILRGKSKQIKH
jgi:hypothetical protein